MHQREKHFHKPAAHATPSSNSATSVPSNNSNGTSNNNNDKKNGKKISSSGAFITGRSPASINIFDISSSPSSSKASPKAQPISVGSKHYKQVKAVAENDGIFKARQIGNNAHSMVKTDRSGLKNHLGEAKKRGVHLGRDDENALETPIFAMDTSDPNYDSQEEDDAFAKDLLRQEKAKRNQGPASAASVYYHNAGASIKPLVTTAPEGSVQLAKKQSSDGNNSLSIRVGDTIGITLPHFKIQVVDLLAEYSVSEDLDEFIRSLIELRGNIWHFELVRRAVTLAMERNPRERELISRLLAQLSQRKVLTTNQAEKGFERLLELADDIQLDIPQTKDFLARFIARAVVDEVITPAFLMDQFIVELGSSVVDQAKVFLSMRHNSARLEHIWGISGSVLPVSELKEQIDMIIQEYIISGDLGEALVCIKTLNVPHFHHEVVKRAVVIGMDHHEKEREMISVLLSNLCSNEILSKHQLLDGYARCVKALPDLTLDAPNAEAVLRIFVMQSVSDGNLSVQDAANLLA